MMTEYNDYYVSGSSLLLTKQEEGEDPSTLNILTIPNKDGSRIKINVLINDVPVRKSRFFGIYSTNNLKSLEVFEELNNWGSDSPPEFRRKIGDHLGRNLRVSNDVIEAQLGIELGPVRAGVRGERRVE